MCASLVKNKEINLLLSGTDKLFRNLIESVHSGIYMADREGNLFFANKAFVEILGYGSKEELLGLNLTKDIYHNPKEREVFLKSMEKTGFVKDFEVRNKRKDGSIAVLSVTSNYIWSENGEVIGVEGIVQDITQKKMLEDNLSKEKAKLEEILYFDEKISAIHNQDELIDFMIKKVKDILNVGKCSLMLVDETTRTLCIKGAIGLSEEVVSRTRVKLGEPIEGLIAQQGQPVLVKNIEYDKRFSRANRSNYLSRSFMSVPIFVENKVIGVVNVSDKDLDPHSVFNDLDLKILCAIVREVAVAIENARLFRELKFLSNVDPKTHIYNYRYFVKTLDYEIKRIKRYHGQLILIMLDIDNFKFVNDHFGHVEGDQLLEEIAQILKGALRETDTVCRYGGDEFAVILPETDLGQARAVGERIRKKIEGIQYLKYRITVSLGIALYQEQLDRFELAMKADQALYQAKKSGKNTVRVSGEG